MTIGYNRLGSNGRFANQMFQYAGLRGVAANRGFDFKVPPPTSYGRSDYALFECFEMGSVKPENFGFVEGDSIQTGQFHFHDYFFNGCPDNVNLHDYFQTEKYFKNIEDTIRSDFTFKQEVVDTCKDFLSTLGDVKIFMHVRRGDYVNHPDQHPALPISYYEEAYEKFPKVYDSCTVPVLIFSDDIEWVKQQEFFQQDHFLISEFNERYPHKSDNIDGEGNSLIPFYDLYMMTQCNGAIIANSSMSWWGAWLQKDTFLPIVAPTPWFGTTALQNIDPKDLIPDDWTQLSW